MIEERKKTGKASYGHAKWLLEMLYRAKLGARRVN